jgi:hypothetical protein
MINFIYYCRNIITNSSAFVWSETQVNLLISLLTKVTTKRAQRLKGESLKEADVKDLSLRGEYLSFIDSVMRKSQSFGLIIGLLLTMNLQEDFEMTTGHFLQNNFIPFPSMTK